MKKLLIKKNEHVIMKTVVIRYKSCTAGDKTYYRFSFIVARHQTIYYADSMGYTSRCQTSFRRQKVLARAL